jgi:hypothetical protein
MALCIRPVFSNQFALGPLPKTAMPLRTRILKAGLAYFALVFAPGFLLGTVRVPFLVPHLGVWVAELLEMPVMFVVILLSARFVVRRFELPASAAVRLTVGIISLALLVGAELSLAVALQGQPLGQYIASRDPVSGGVYIAMLMLYAAMPLIHARAHGARLFSGNERA